MIKKNNNSKILKVILIGRPNVGKSTLFNKLCGKKLAIVDDIPGVTRDTKAHYATLYDLKFIAMDTAGWTVKNIDEDLNNIMSINTEKNILDADAILFMVDGIEGINPNDIDFADKVRKTSQDIILLVNKSEAGEKKSNIDSNQLYKLGLGEPIRISAMHSTGLDDLYTRLSEMMREKYPDYKNDDYQNTQNDDDNIIKIGIVGRPNVGKSTLFNHILGKQRSIVSDISGTTRDAISDEIEIDIGDTTLKTVLIDTAGMRKKNKVNEEIESRSLGQSITAIKRSNVVIVTMDATMPFEKQDLAIAKIAINEGKGLVFAVNKMDLLDSDVRQNITKKLDEISYNQLNGMEKIPLVYLSALHGKYTNLLFKKAFEVFEKYQKSISTGRLNKWLKDVTTSCPPPLLKSRKTPINIKYITQTSSKPPTFLIFTNTKSIPTHYIRFLKKSLARRFEMEGIVIRINIKVSENPYVPKTSRKTSRKTK